MDSIEHARRIVAAHVRQARVALLTGSSARGLETSTSDLDIYTLVDGPPAPFRETFVDEGRLVELFVSTHESLERFATSELAKRLPTTVHMCANSVVILGGDEADQIKRWASEELRKGPSAFSDDELDSQRYSISSLIDDLADATAVDERIWIANETTREVADFFLISNGNWTGRGKWLARRLHDANPAVAQRLADAYVAAIGGDIQELRDLALLVLKPFGGFLQGGYRQSAG